MRETCTAHAWERETRGKCVRLTHNAWDLVGLLKDPWDLLGRQPLLEGVYVDYMYGCGQVISSTWYMYVWLCMEELVTEVKQLLQQLEVDAYAHKEPKG